MESANAAGPTRRGRASSRLVAWAWIVALASACGGNSPAAPPAPTSTPTPPPPTLADLSATVSSPEADARLACRDDVHARVTLTNRAQRGVVVTGIRKTNATLRGSCIEAGEGMYTSSTRTVAGNSSTVVMDRPLYAGGSGCCTDPDACRGNCDFQETFEVITEVGAVPAGRFQYNVTFQNCVACSSLAATGLGGCPPSVSLP